MARHLSLNDITHEGCIATATIGINSSDDSSWVGYVGYDSGAMADWNGDPVIYPIAGDLAGFDLYSVNEYELTAAGFTSLPVAGLQFELKLDILPEAEPFKVYLQDDAGQEIDSIIIPEPVTFIMFAAGAAFIRRKY